VGRLGLAMRVSASFQIIPCPVGRRVAVKVRVRVRNPRCGSIRVSTPSRGTVRVNWSMG